MANLSSSAVQLVYPSIKRDSANSGNTYRASRVSTEQNLCRFTGQFLDNDYFVISKTVDANGIFEFNIKGYYFRVSTKALIGAAQGNTVTVKLADIVEPTGSSVEYGELNGIDSLPTGQDNTVYTGFETVEAGPEGTYTLLVQDKSGNWKIPDSAKQVFNWERVDFNITAIDCGEIE